MKHRIKNIIDPALTALIAANVAVFIVLAVAGLLTDADLSRYIGLSPSATSLISRPWTIITYSFAQANVLQLVFNMLWLYGFGRLLLIRCRPGMLVALYLSGAVAGALFFIAFSSLLGANASGLLIGSSAAIIAVAVAVAVMMPDTEVTLPLIGQAKIKWIVTVVVVIFCIGLSAPNAGGNLAHLGGAAAGAAIALAAGRRRAPKSKSEYGHLVEKIRRTGYDALSAKEKRRFFELSSKKQS